ncbi:MAG: leucine-rich repeat domain-containing protein [Paludibacteraceae bacterium]|nr:leucine-rich repeat domain-containing protein [Paludibacteraceae bacterium]
MCKRLLYLILLLTQFLSVNAENFEEEALYHDFVEGNLCFTILDKTAKEAEVSGTTLKVEQEIKRNFALFDVSIPSSVSFKGETYNVTTVSNNAFRGCKNILSLTVEGGVTYIGKSAFEDCDHLNNVYLAEGVAYVGDNAFAGCTALPAVHFPKTLAFVGKGAFSRCMNIKALSFPSLVNELDPSVFEGCASLETITVEEGNQNMQSVDGVLYNKEQTTLICCPEARNTALIIPHTVSLVSWSFPSSCKLTCLSCSSEVPPVVTATAGGPANISLFVPKRVVSAYEQDVFWSRFVIRPY